MGSRSILVAFVLASALACAGEPLGGIASSRSETEYQQAVALIPVDPARAEAALEAYVEAWPRSARADDALLDEARLLLARGDEAGAVERLNRAIREHPRGDRTDSARLLLARVERDRGRLDAATRAASALRPRKLESHERIQAYLLLADLAARRDDTVARLRWLGRVVGEADSAVDVLAADREIDKAVSGMDRQTLVHVADQLGEDPPAARLRLQAAELDLARRDVAGAEAQLDRAAKASLRPSDTERLEALRTRLRALQGVAPLPGGEALPGFEEVAGRAVPDTGGAVGTLGVVLPLSGPYARFGEASLRGVLVAAGIFDRDGAGPRVRLLVRDSRGQPQAAAAAVAELAGREDVAAIIGPLRAEEAESAGAAAETAGVPLLTLTSREDVAHDRPHVFRLGLTPRSEVERLADYVLGQHPGARVAILHPRDAAGRGLKDLFWDAVLARGGEVVGVASYPPDATDFRDPIRRLVGFVLLSPAEQQALDERDHLMTRAKRLPHEEAAELREKASELLGPGGEPLPPIVDFDVLFVPDGYEKVALIAPQLAFNEVRDATLVGPSGWNHPDLLKIGGEHLEGADFTEGFYAKSRFPFVERFSDACRATLGTEPDFLAAQAYDATNLALVQLARGRTSRSDLREGLLAVQAYPGASGVTTIGADGNAHKRPFLLGVRGGQIVSLD